MFYTHPGFLSINDLVDNQGELTLSLKFDSDTQDLSINACTQLLPDSTQQDIAMAYISLCDSNSPLFHNFFDSHSDNSESHQPKLRQLVPVYTFPNTQKPLAICTGKKYKPVALKVRPVETELPSKFQIMHNIKGDPLKDMPVLLTNPPTYAPTRRYTEERKEVIDKVHAGNFLLLEERKLLHHFMSV